MEHRAEKIKINSLRHFEGNARRGDIDTIRQSLRKNGQYRPIVVRTETMEVLAGNQTMDAARAEGWEEIWVTWVSCDDAQAIRINLVDNRAPELGGYDSTALLAQLQALPELDGTGWSSDDLLQLAGPTQLGEGESSADQDNVSVKPAILLICPNVNHQVRLEKLLQQAAVEGKITGLVELLADVEIQPVAI